MQFRNTSISLHKIYSTVSTIKRAKQIKNTHIKNEQTNNEQNKDDQCIFELRLK